MGNQPRISSPGPSRRSAPATTPEGREHQLVSLAHDLVEQRLMDGTASATETVHFLKLGSTRERLEQQRLEADVKLQLAKIESLESQARMEELYANAIGAMSRYQGNAAPIDPAYDDGYE
jgi:hypothetical protein